MKKTKTKNFLVLGKRFLKGSSGSLEVYKSNFEKLYSKSVSSGEHFNPSTQEAEGCRSLSLRLAGATRKPCVCVGGGGDFILTSFRKPRYNKVFLNANLTLKDKLIFLGIYNKIHKNTKEERLGKGNH